MTIKPDLAEVCWQPVNPTTGVCYYDEHQHDYWPHYRTKAASDAEIAKLLKDDDRLKLVSRPCSPTPCVVIACDGCDEEFGWQDDGEHFDPVDPMPVSITDGDWTITRGTNGERHWCPDCCPSYCDDCDERHDEDDPCPAAPARQPVAPIPGQMTIEECLAEAAG